jgi:methionyl aminopeptidase
VSDKQSHFCGKECFQQAWAEHKLLHKKAKEAVVQALPPGSYSAAAPLVVSPFRSNFEGYSFTGPLRPFPVTAVRSMPPHIGRPDYAVTGVPRSELAERGKNIVPVWTSEEDVANMRRAGALAREVTDIAARALRPGTTGEEIDRIVHAACIERGVYPSPLNYHNFPKSV